MLDKFIRASHDKSALNNIDNEALQIHKSKREQFKQNQSLLSRVDELERLVKLLDQEVLRLKDLNGIS